MMQDYVIHRISDDIINRVDKEYWDNASFEDHCTFMSKFIWEADVEVSERMMSIYQDIIKEWRRGK